MDEALIVTKCTSSAALSSASSTVVSPGTADDRASDEGSSNDAATNVYTKHLPVTLNSDALTALLKIRFNVLYTTGAAVFK